MQTHTSNTTSRILWALLIVGLLWVGCERAAPVEEPAHTPTSQKAIAAAKGLDPQGRMQISPEDRCAVCGMAVAQHTKFASAIALDDGTTYHFCGTGCMLRSWLHPEIFIGHDKARLGRAVTSEYFAGEHIDAASAHWVVGSDVVGPMGPAIVPLKNADDLKTFQSRHGGKATFKLTELDDAKWETLTGKKAVKTPK